MIVDKIANAHLYYGLGPAFERALRYVASTSLAGLPDGKQTIDSEIVLGINSYQTKEHDTAFLEAHRLHADIQLMISGSEKIGFASLGDSPVSTDYDPKKDIQFFGKEAETFTLREGYFAIFFPTDLHMPSLADQSQAAVRKAVFKIRL